MSDPLVSIITPTYNHEKYIGKCIKSVLSQTFEDWEMIIIDDGSTDDTLQIVKSFDDSRIELVTQENKGVYRLSETYNKGLTLSSGKYIAVLEGDDFWPKNKLEIQTSCISDKEAVLVWGNCVHVDENDKPKEAGPLLGDSRIFSSLEILEMFLRRNRIPAVTAMIRKKSLSSIEGFKQPEGCPFVDYPTWLELGLEGNFFYQDKVLGFWRRHPQQVTKHEGKKISAWGTKCALDFYKNLSSDLKDNLNIDEENIKAPYYILKAGQSIRIEAWKEANFYLKKALKYGESRERIRAILGLIGSMVRIDMIDFMESLKPRLLG